jgi:hypothetical protein
MTIIARALRSSLESAAVDADITSWAVTMAGFRANEANPGPAFDQTPDPPRDR